MEVRENIKKGSIIVLGWPNTRVRRIGVWYDQLMQWLGFIKRDYYKAGHAAAVLVDQSNGSLHYFDFGRYHTPEKMGRYRSHRTDPELQLKTRAIFGKDHEIENLTEILMEVSHNPSTHGTGTLYASVSSGIDFNKAYKYTNDLQQKGTINFGPFDLSGTNCARFVRDLLLAAGTGKFIRLRLMFPWLITPTTKGNVLNASVDGKYFVVDGTVMERKRKSVFDSLFNFVKPFQKNGDGELESRLLVNQVN